MKTRKTLPHAQLMSEVFVQLKFPIAVRIDHFPYRHFFLFIVLSRLDINS